MAEKVVLDVEIKTSGSQRTLGAIRGTSRTIK